MSNDIAIALATEPTLFYGLIFLVSISIGSFLNVVIYRLPIMMQREWRKECHEFLELDDQEKNEPFDLSRPRSACPQCNHLITAVENIPLLSYALQRGKCTHCGSKISAQYPLVELFTGLISMLVAYQFGPSIELIPALIFTWALIALSGIDIKTQLLPDQIVFPLLWLGLLVNTQNMFSGLNDAVWGAALGYMSLWLIFQTYRLITKKEGMGFGDFKLLAALAAWTGIHMLPFMIFLSAVMGAIIGISLIASKIISRENPIPFGPYLALAGWIALIFPSEVDALINAYFSLF